ncbi:hypothetical protein VUJ46_02040 [Chryseobacterium sp. MYb264]|uniref:hypothetical protein n=1 Tax=Chryseobacterium sp. MYb264 TaxID=2745153 RepID=UPI002E0D67BE|nr:hypothetical protein VUJ46_02040 [Chryseobacterium sp. MYb264]
MLLIASFQLLSISVFSQNNANLSTLLDKNSEFILPQTQENISKVLKIKPEISVDANEEKYASWRTKSGLELYSSLGNGKINEIFFDIPDDQFIIVSGLPYQLTINKTTAQEVKATFAKYNPKSEKLGEDSSFSGGSKLTVKKGKNYLTLLFDRKNLLKSLSITESIIDPAAN